MKPILHDAKFWMDRPMTDEKDWVDDETNWIDSYVASVNHPHRDLILNAIESLCPMSVLEVGCNAGPNLMRIQEAFPELKLAGIDVSKKCIARAKKHLKADLKTASYFSIPFRDKSYDLVLADAVLMYANPNNIEQAMLELDRVSRGYIIIVDRINRSKGGVRNGHVWKRNYKKLLEGMGYAVIMDKITEEQWPHSIGWQKFGAFLVATK